MRRISEIKEIINLETVNELLNEGWIYLATNVSLHPSVYILGKLNQFEPEQTVYNLRQ